MNICGITTNQFPYRSETNGSSENAVRKVKERISAFLVQSCLSKIKIWYQDVSRKNARNSGGGWNGDLIIVDWSHIGSYAASEVHMKRFKSKEEATLGFVKIFLDGYVYILNMHVYHIGVCVCLAWCLCLSRLVFVSVSLGVRLGVSCSCVISLSVCVISLIVCVFFLCVCVYISWRNFCLSWCWCLPLDGGLSLDVGLSLDIIVSLLIELSLFDIGISWFERLFSGAHHIHIVHRRTPRTLLFSVARITIAFTFLCGVANSWCRWGRTIRCVEAGLLVMRERMLFCRVTCFLFVSLFSQVLLAHSLHSQHFLQCFFNVSSTFLRIRHWAGVSSLC